MFIVNEFNVVLPPGCNWQSKYIWMKCSPYDYDELNTKIIHMSGRDWLFFLHFENEEKVSVFK